MISLVQIPVHRCYTGNIVRVVGYGYGSYWLNYVSCSSALLPRIHSGSREADVKPPMGDAPLLNCLHCVPA